MITTVKEYCALRGVTRQFVYQYVREGKFELREMPAFVEIEGKKIKIGMEKVLIVPEEFAAKSNDNLKFSFLDAVNFVEYLTSNLELQEFYSKYLGIKDREVRASFKKAMYENIDQRPELERNALKTAIDEANIKLMQRMVSLEKNLKELLKKENEVALVS